MKRIRVYDIDTYKCSDEEKQSASKCGETMKTFRKKCDVMCLRSKNK